MQATECIDQPRGSIFAENPPNRSYEDISRLNEDVGFRVNKRKALGNELADIALKFLSAALVYFHSSPVMTPATLSDFPTDIEKLTIEFVNLSLQEVSNLWTVRGSLYLPSFVLKLTPGR